MDVLFLLLVDWTGRAVRADKSGSIPTEVVAILHRFSINDAAWVDAECQFEGRFGHAIGAELALRRFMHNLNSHWLRGKRSIQQLYRQIQAA